jgi:hypothetical protein
MSDIRSPRQVAADDEQCWAEKLSREIFEWKERRKGRRRAAMRSRHFKPAMRASNAGTRTRFHQG